MVNGVFGMGKGLWVVVCCLRYICLRAVLSGAIQASL